LAVEALSRTQLLDQLRLAQAKIASLEGAAWQRQQASRRCNLHATENVHGTTCKGRQWSACCSDPSFSRTIMLQCSN
jgi:hypothetical protein